MSGKVGVAPISCRYYRYYYGRTPAPVGARQVFPIVQDAHVGRTGRGGGRQKVISLAAFIPSSSS